MAVTRLHAKDDKGSAVPLSLVQLDEGPLVLGQADALLRPGERAAIDFRTAGDDGTLIPCFYRKA